MIVTMLEAEVAEDRTDALVESFERTGRSLPEPIVESLLLRVRGSDRWRILTVWSGAEGLDRYRRSVEVPEGVVMFRDAGAEPSLSVAEVVAHVGRG